MTWSTRELAGIAGTTVNAVRHYHEIGLLDAPKRSGNGYKHYEVPHLVRLLQVRRLAEMGVPLAQLRADEKGGVVVLGGLEALDAQVKADIERLLRTRSDIAATLRDRAPAGTPRGFESLAPYLSEADRALVHIVTRLHDGGSVSALMHMVAAESAELREAFSVLRADAPARLRERLACSITAAGPNWRSAERLLSTFPAARMRSHDVAAKRTIVGVLRELYNPAQLDALQRAGAGVAVTAVAAA